LVIPLFYTFSYPLYLARINKDTNFLLGVFIGQTITTTTGQTAIWDVVSSGLLVLWVEWISWIAYRGEGKKSFGINIANVFKAGITYSLFLEAFKVGS